MKLCPGHTLLAGKVITDPQEVIVGWGNCLPSMYPWALLAPGAKEVMPDNSSNTHEGADSDRAACQSTAWQVHARAALTLPGRKPSSVEQLQSKLKKAHLWHVKFCRRVKDRPGWLLGRCQS